jgi:outer membrane lipoprotein carrier protein
MSQARTGRPGAALLLLALLGLFSAALHAEEGPARLRAFLADLRSLEARFVQERFDESGAPVERSEGTFRLLRPSRFLWDYTTPVRQQVLSDGRQVYIHDIELEQVTVRAFDAALAGSPAALLGAEEDIDALYELSELPPTGGLTWVGLVSREEEGDFAGVRLGFDARGLKVMELDDEFGQRTRIEFSELRVNTVIAADTFAFSPPPGVDVVRGD